MLVDGSGLIRQRSDVVGCQWLCVNRLTAVRVGGVWLARLGVSLEAVGGAGVETGLVLEQITNSLLLQIVTIHQTLVEVIVASVWSVAGEWPSQ